MKQIKTTTARTKLRINTETVRAMRLLTPAELDDVQGGQMHTSFSCGANLCTTHNA